jgi:hypothetical protein
LKRLLSQDAPVVRRIENHQRSRAWSRAAYDLALSIRQLRLDSSANSARPHRDLDPEHQHIRSHRLPNKGLKLTKTSLRSAFAA